MDSLNLFQAIIIGIVEGLTEFLPVSSTGHIILVQELLGFKSPPGKAFEVIIQLGSILAICWLYRRRLMAIASGLLRKDKEALHITLSIAAAFVPAMVIGLIFHGFIKEHLFQPIVVVTSLIIGGLVIILIERMNHTPKIMNYDSIPIKTAIYIGFFQCIAMIPGVSRSGATIIGALLMGVERKAAAEFSFLLAIPTIFAASVYDGYKNFGQFSEQDLIITAAGFVSAFITALVVVKWFMAYIKRHNFTAFGYYRIVFGIISYALLLS